MSNMTWTAGPYISEHGTLRKRLNGYLTTWRDGVELELRPSSKGAINENVPMDDDERIGWHACLALVPVDPREHRAYILAVDTTTLHHGTELPKDAHGDWSEPIDILTALSRVLG